MDSNSDRDYDEVTSISRRHGASSSSSSSSSSNNNNSNNNNNNNNKKKQEILVERTVITDAIIKNAVYKDLLTYYDASSVPSEDLVDLSEVRQLILSFRTIFAIQNLEGFEKLTKLQLDNNIIENIENLSHLTNLTWLDLSFNKLRSISGLSSLTKLTDLNLFNNSIERIDGGCLDACTQLHILSLGNNRISDLKSCIELRRFRHLRSLSLAGNPVASNHDYTNSMYAFLPQLTYLDYVAIEEKPRAKACDAKLDDLLLLEAKEKIKVQEDKAKAIAAAHLEAVNSANCIGLESLFSDTLRVDAEQPKLMLLPGYVDLLLPSYKTSFDAVIAEFIEDMIKRSEMKKQERKDFLTVRDRLNEEAEEESRNAIQAYDKLKKRAMREYADSVYRYNNNASSHGHGHDHLHGHGHHHSNSSTSSNNNNSMHINVSSLSHTINVEVLTSLLTSVSTLCDSLMDIEMHVVEQHALMLDEFEKAYSKLLSDNVVKIARAFRLLIDVSSKHVAAVYDTAHRVLEQFARDEAFGEALEVQVRALLTDKDALNNSISASHENHDARILQKEDEIREREEFEGKSLIRSYRDAEYTRNRKRVAEIYELKAREEATIQAKRQTTNQDDDDKNEN